MNWNNLRDAKCPKCSENMNIDGQKGLCGFCGFSLSLKKIEEICKPKDQSAKYRKAINRNKSITKYKETLKQRTQKALEAQKRERRSNLDRMLARKEITFEEYNLKVATI